MKKIIAFLVALSALLSSCALAFDMSKFVYYDLEPGIYEVGVDIPAGDYDVRFVKMEHLAALRYSDRLTEDGELDMSWMYSYSFLYTAQWNQGMYAVITLPSTGYLEIEYSTLRLWPED